MIPNTYNPDAAEVEARQAAAYLTIAEAYIEDQEPQVWLLLRGPEAEA